MEKGLIDFEKHIKFLRNLQELRSSGTGHRKGENYFKICNVFGISNNNHKEAFSKILMDSTAFLRYIEDNVDILNKKL